MPADHSTPPLVSGQEDRHSPTPPRGEQALTATEWINLATTLIHLAIDGIGDRTDAHDWLDALTDTLHTAITGQDQ